MIRQRFAYGGYTGGQPQQPQQPPAMTPQPQGSAFTRPPHVGYGQAPIGAWLQQRPQLPQGPWNPLLGNVPQQVNTGADQRHLERDRLRAMVPPRPQRPLSIPATAPVPDTNIAAALPSAQMPNPMDTTANAAVPPATNPVTSPAAASPPSDPMAQYRTDMRDWRQQKNQIMSTPYGQFGYQPRFATGGVVHSPTAGRADAVDMNVDSDSYVMPADVVSALGEGNSMAGSEILSKMFKSQGPATSSPDGVPISASGGEFVVSPEIIKLLGGGDVAHGHNILDSFVKKIRSKAIKTLKKLPRPKK